MSEPTTDRPEAPPAGSRVTLRDINWNHGHLYRLVHESLRDRDAVWKAINSTVVTTRVIDRFRVECRTNDWVLQTPTALELQQLRSHVGRYLLRLAKDKTSPIQRVSNRNRLDYWRQPDPLACLAREQAQGAA